MARNPVTIDLTEADVAPARGSLHEKLRHIFKVGEKGKLALTDLQYVKLHERCFDHVRFTHKAGEILLANCTYVRIPAKEATVELRYDGTQVQTRARPAYWVLEGSCVTIREWAPHEDETDDVTFENDLS